MKALVLAFVSACLGVTSLLAQALTDDAVRAAIKAGESKKFDTLISDCTATAGFGEALGAGIAGGIRRNGSFDVIVSATAGRIAFMAAQAKRLYKPLSLDAIPETLREPAVFVTVEPNEPSRASNSISVAAPIEHIVLKSKGNGEAVVQPVAIDKEAVEWSNLLGGKVEANRAVARFDLGSVLELPAGEFDVVVITTNGERRCKVGTKDRTRLFGGR